MEDINAILNDPERIKSLLGDEKVKELIKQFGIETTTERTVRPKMSEGIRITKKYDRHKQFRGCTIQIVSKRLKDGSRVITVPANGFSERETLIKVDEEVKMLKKKYKVENVVY